MQYCANSEERAAIIAGLHGLAEFLDQDPLIPVPRSAELMVFPTQASNQQMFAEIDTVADQLGTTATSDGSPAGHYSACRDFGPVRYRAVAIPNHSHDTSGKAD